MSKFPAAHQTFLERALPALTSDARLLGVAGAGSLLTGGLDEFSDLDLVVVCANEFRADLMQERFEIVGRLGSVLSAFSGEHVGEPRILICLYEDPLLHVDVKFLSLCEFEVRIEDPVVLWERGSALSQVLAAHPSVPSTFDHQWAEDRFWVWIHYAAQRLGRGELFEAIDTLAFLRDNVLGPLALVRNGHLPRGTRRVEMRSPREAHELRETLSIYEFESCRAALLAAAKLYKSMRSPASPVLVHRDSAQEAALAYLCALSAPAEKDGRK